MLYFNTTLAHIWRSRLFCITNSRSVASTRHKTTRSPPKAFKEEFIGLAESQAKQWRRRTLAMGGGGFIFLAGVYATARYFREDPLPPKLADGQDVSDRYDKIASRYDRDVSSTEFWLGIGLLRKWMVKMAAGNVLEVGVGTGRNSRYYDTQKCKSITMIDQSKEMIEIAKAAFKEVHPRRTARRYIVQSAFDPISTPSGGFDTVIETMGLCSTPDPVGLLQKMAAVTNVERGRILLLDNLEHGKAHYDWLNERLDYYAPGHANKFGCWWNRDIGKIVEDSGLEVIKMKRYHFGTTWWIELRPRRTPSAS